MVAVPSPFLGCCWCSPSTPRLNIFFIGSTLVITVGIAPPPRISRKFGSSIFFLSLLLLLSLLNRWWCTTWNNGFSPWLAAHTRGGGTTMRRKNNVARIVFLPDNILHILFSPFISIFIDPKLPQQNTTTTTSFPVSLKMIWSLTSRCHYFVRDLVHGATIQILHLNLKNVCPVRGAPVCFSLIKSQLKMHRAFVIGHYQNAWGHAYA